MEPIPDEQSKPTKYWKTTLTVTVFSTGEAPPSYDSISHLHDEISEGKAAGQITRNVFEEIGAQSMVDALEVLGEHAEMWGIPVDEDNRVINSSEHVV